MSNLDRHDRATLQLILARYLETPGASEREARVSFAREIELIGRLIDPHASSEFYAFFVERNPDMVLRVAVERRDAGTRVETTIRFDDDEGSGNDGPALRMIEAGTEPAIALELVERKLDAAAVMVRKLIDATKPF